MPTRIAYARAALLAAVAGCDTSYGVVRSAPVARVPPPAEVEALVRAAPGVQAVEYRAYESGRPLTSHGLGAPTLAHTFVYYLTPAGAPGGTGRVAGVLEFTEDDRHQATYVQSLTRMGSAPTPRELAAARPVMREIEARLEAHAGLAGLRRAVVQRCHGVECG